MGTGAAFTLDAGADRPVLQPPHRPVGHRPAGADPGRRASDRQSRASNNIAVLDVQTDDAFAKPGDNFFVSRYSRDVLRRSRVGAIFINKESVDGSPHYNRTMGVDGNFSLGNSFQVNSYVAKTVTNPDQPWLGAGSATGHGVLRPRRLSRPADAGVAQRPGRAGELQPRSRVPAAHGGHPHHQGLLQPDAPAEARRHQGDGADVRADLHHQPDRASWSGACTT